MKYKIKFKRDSIVSTLIFVLMYIFVIVIFYNKMLDQLPTHWGLNGQVDSFASKLKVLVLDGNVNKSIQLSWNSTGLLLILFGKFLPKLKNNYVVGIKLPWTLNSDENWRRTHRLGGFTYVIGGSIILIGGLIFIELLQVTGIILVVIPPILYSFYLYTEGM